MAKEEISKQDIDDMIALIDGKMDSGVSRLKVKVSDELKAGTVKEQ